MEIEFIYGPRTSIREHVNREVGAALIAGGFAVEISKVDANTELERARNAHPPAGWSIVRGGPFAEKIWMRHDDGHGQFQLFDKLPAPQRVWIFDPEKDSEGHYELRQMVDIPQQVLAEFQRLGGQPVDYEAAGIAYREKLARQQYAQDSQNRTADVRRFMGKAQ